jgi:cytochrome c oxidase assembly factor CtaG
MAPHLVISFWPPTHPDAWAWSLSLHLAGLLVAVLPAAATVAVVRARGIPLPRRRHLYLGGGTLLLLLGLNWPLADLAQITLSGRTVQYLLLTLMAPPLLLLGIPRWRATGRGALRRVLEGIVGVPWVGAILLGVVTWLTHTPGAIEALDATPEIAAATRLGWLATALVYWWPLVGPGPERERLPYFAGVGYLVLPFVFPKFPAATWVFATDLLHERYATLPGEQVWGLSPLTDQGVAAFILWLPGSLVVAAAIYLLFRHWFEEDRRMLARQRLGIPADPTALAVLMAGPHGPDLWDVLEALVGIIDDASPPRLGSDLGFEVRRERVVLQLQVPEGPTEAREVLARRIEAGYTVYLRRYPPERAAAIRERLTVEVVPYGARVR